jgi:hypothetical protein
MRLLKTSLATVAVLALAGTAFANTRDEAGGTLSGTSHVQAGAKLHMVISRKPQGNVFHVVATLDVTMKSKARLRFGFYPCKSTSCASRGTTTTTSALTPGRRWHLSGKARVPVILTGGQECVFVQIRDLGPNGKEPGTIVRRNGHPGLRVCRG